MERLSPPPPAHRAYATHTEDNRTVLALWGFEYTLFGDCIVFICQEFGIAQTALAVGRVFIAP